ncbi:MAG TPA: MFS transporter [Thermomicrobiales bacterium]|nr:MFS transporter [Thermomicrobiales bacterium]
MHDQHQSTGGPSTPRWPWLQPDLGLGRNNGILFWVHLIWGAGFTIQAALWTLFIESLGATPTQIGLVLGGGAVVRTILAIPAGHLADRFPLKPVIIAMMAVPIFGAISLALATQWWHALAGAVLMDMSGVAIPAVSAYVAAASKPEDRTRTMTYIFTLSWLISMTVAPAIGGWLAETSGFRTVYLVGAALFAAGIVVATRIDNIRPSQEPAETGSAAQPIGYRDLLRSTGVHVILGFHLLVPLLVVIGFALMPNFMNDDRGVSLSTIGVLASIGAVLAFGMSLLVSHWKPLTSPFMGMAAILSIAALSMALMLSFTALPIVAFAFMLRMCFSPIWSLMASAVAEVTPERVRGRAYGLCEFVVGIGDTTAPIASGRLYATDHRLPLIVGLVTTAPLALASLVAHRLRGRFGMKSTVSDDRPSSETLQRDIDPTVDSLSADKIAVHPELVEKSIRR